MADESVNTDLIVQQKAMFRLAAREGFSQELLHQETGLPTTSLSDWATGKAKISLVGVRKIAAVPDFPLDLLSLLLPQGLAIVRIPEGVDYDALAAGCLAYVEDKNRFHHPESEEGRDLGPTERAKLDRNVVALKARA